MNDAQEIRERFEKQIGAVIDAGACPSQPTTVVDLTPMARATIRWSCARAVAPWHCSACKHLGLKPGKGCLRQSTVDFSNLIQTVLIYALPVLFAITVHEAAHGYVARHFGDNTADRLGRITLNPFKHIDPLGTILMPVMLYVATSGAFLSDTPSRCR